MSLEPINIIQKIEMSKSQTIFNVFGNGVWSYEFSKNELQKVLFDYEKDITDKICKFRKLHLNLIQNLEILEFDVEYILKNKVNKIYKYYGESITTKPKTTENVSGNQEIF